MYTELITWHPIEDGPPKKEGLYLVTRDDGIHSVVIFENWYGPPLERQWDGDPPIGGSLDGAWPEEGPVVAWAEMPRGYAEM